MHEDVATYNRQESLMDYLSEAPDGEVNKWRIHLKEHSLTEASLSKTSTLYQNKC